MRKIILLLVFLSTELLAQSPSAAKNAVIKRHFRVASTNEADGADPDKAIINIQYLDGLGREVQQLGYRQSPNYKDIVLSHITFDQYGRAVKNHLAAPSTTNTGAFSSNINALGQAFYSDTTPYAETTAFDSSPLHRPTEQYGPGSAWRTANKSTALSYTSNAANEVAYYTATVTGSITLSGFYPQNTLHKQQTTDEQGDKLITFSNTFGQTVATWQELTAGVYAKTHYIYAAGDRIRAVIQPEGVGLNTSLSAGSTNWNNYVFFYTYDHRARIIEKKIPGADKEYFVFDKWDRLVASQTALQRTNGNWSFFKYDAHGHLVYSGEYSNGQSRASLQTSAVNFENGKTWIHESRNTIGPIYYSLNTTFPTAISAANVRQVNYYDTYSNWLPAGMAFDAGNAFHAKHSSSQGLLTGSKSKKTENSNWLSAASYFDTKGRVIQAFSQNTYGHIERTDFEYLFAGEVSKVRMLCKDANGNSFTKLKTYAYDHAGRPKTYDLSLGNINERISESNYDELGRLNKKTYLPNGTFLYAGAKDYLIRPSIDGIVSQSNTQDIARKAIILEPTLSINAVNLSTYSATIDPNASSGTPITGLQQMNYSYHLRGALQGINLNAAGHAIPEATEGDLFAYKLEYETAGQWDGNIGKQSWASTGSASNNSIEERNYTFSYDPAKRLTTATYAGVGAENFSLPSIHYDKNGNILSLQRNGALTSSTFGMMDNLTYTYAGNRLNVVSDAISGDHEVDLVPRSGGAYTYYGNGALKSDANEDISLINYDGFLSQPAELQLTAAPGVPARWIKHYYSGSGSLLQTEYANGETWKYTTAAVFKNDTLYQINDDEGRILFDAASNQFTYEFNYQDHLGNTRVSFKADGSNLEKVAETAFDPWGVRLVGVGSQNGIQNRGELQGKEKESTFGLRRLSFGARTYNASIGRWDKVDPMSEKREWLSSYNYVQNNPIARIDPNGAFDTKAEAKQHAKEQKIRTGWFSRSKIKEQSDGSFAINNKKESTSISNDADFGVMTGALVLGEKSNDFGLSDAGNATAAIGFSTGGVANRIGSVLENRGVYGNLHPETIVRTPGRLVPNIKVPTRAFAKVGSNLKLIGRASGVAGLFITGVQYSQGEITGLEASIDATFGAIGFTGIGTPISLAYFGGKFAYEYATGKTVFVKPK